MFALISRISKLYAQNYGCGMLVSEEQMVEFLEISLSRAGADSMVTPREMIRDYMTVLNIMMQNPNVSFNEIVGATVSENTEDDEADKKEFTPKKAGDFTANDIEF